METEMRKNGYKQITLMKMKTETKISVKTETKR